MHVETLIAAMDHVGPKITKVDVTVKKAMKSPATSVKISMNALPSIPTVTLQPDVRIFQDHINALARMAISGTLTVYREADARPSETASLIRTAQFLRLA